MGHAIYSSIVNIINLNNYIDISFTTSHNTVTCLGPGIKLNFKFHPFFTHLSLLFLISLPKLTLTPAISQYLHDISIATLHLTSTTISLRLSAHDSNQSRNIRYNIKLTFYNFFDNFKLFIFQLNQYK